MEAEGGEKAGVLCSLNLPCVCALSHYLETGDLED